jgi:RNA polymerase sigma-32 factor
VRVAKSKSEPRKPKKKPAGSAVADGATLVEAAAPVEAARPHAVGKPAGDRAKGKPRAARKPAAQDDGHARADDDDEDDDGGEEREDHEEREEREERETAEPDGEAVEVVGEIVDEPTLDGEGIGAPMDASEVAAVHAEAAEASSEAALSRSDPLQAYLREVQRHALLTPDEEKRLTEHYQKAQDVQTAARLVTANLRLVVKLAYEYRRAYKNIMDLIQEGNIGLMQAVKRYDPYRGVKLSSYAAWWIRAYILRFILNNWRLVKLGTTQAQRKLFFNLNKEKARLSAMGIEPSAAEIARRLAVEEKEVVEMDRRLSSGEASLDAPVGDSDGRPVSRLEMLPSHTITPDAAFEAREIGELVHDRLTTFRRTLKGKDVIIFDKRMAAEDPLTLQELGEEFGVSRERVRQLEARLTMKLRAYLKEELGEAVGAG